VTLVIISRCTPDRATCTCCTVRSATTDYDQRHV